MLANDLAAALDPVVLAHQLGFDPDPWQKEFLRSTAGRILLNCSRQAGKSTMTALLGVHTAVYHPDSLVLMLSPSLRQSQELFRKASGLYERLSGVSPAKSESALKLELENESRIISLPGKEQTVRGFSGVNLLAVDEAARVPDELYYAVRPMLAVSGGRLIVLSTPDRARGWFYEAWRSQEPWERFEIPAVECPRIRAEFLEEEKRNIGESWFRQEYGCEFLASESQAFRREDIERAFEEEVEQWTL